MIWSTACPDWEARITAGTSLAPCAPLFPAEAAAALEQFGNLKLVDVIGCPTIADSCRQWVFDFAGAVFGAYDVENNAQMIQDYLLLVSKKNSKSTIAAGIMLTALLRNDRQSAEFFIVAPTIEAARNAFKPAADMIRADDELSDLLHVKAAERFIIHRETGASLKVLAAEGRTVSGKKTSGVLVDELWEFGKKAGAEDMLREITGGLASRSEGFVIYLSTMSDAPPAGVFKQKLDYFRDVRDGKVIDPKSFGMIYEFPKGVDYLDPANFYMTNPNLGLSVRPDFLVSELEKARYHGDVSLCGFAAKHLNVEIGMGLRSDGWPGAEFWERQTDPDLTLDTLLERSEVVVIGHDGGGMDDLSGLAVIGRDKVTKDWLVWAHAWCHRGVLTRRKSIASVLADFVVDGDLTIFDDGLADTGDIIEIIAQVKATGLLSEVWVDPYGLGEMVDALAEVEVTEENEMLKAAKQGIGLMTAVKSTERKLANGTLWHSGSRMMKWCITNLKIEPTPTAFRVTKAHAGDAKIDPAMAMFDAVAGMSMNPGVKGSPEIHVW